MAMTAAQEARLIVSLCAALRESGVTPDRTGVLVYDHNWDDPQYPIDVLTNITALSEEEGVVFPTHVVGVAWHCYAGNVEAQSIVHARFPQLEVFFTECTGGSWATNFSKNLVWDVQNLIVGATRNWASAVLKWNLALTPEGGPKRSGGCSDCRGIITVSDVTSEWLLNEDYYALRHLSGFVCVRGGCRSTRVYSNGTSAVVWCTSSDKSGAPCDTMTLVGANTASETIVFTIVMPSSSGPRCAVLTEVPPLSAFTVQWPVTAQEAPGEVRWWITADVWSTTGVVKKRLFAEPPTSFVRC
jgi:glucosylceramidase